MTQITSREKLKEWLKEKPEDLAQVIAARIALRVLPYAFANKTPREWIVGFSLSLFRLSSISWAARNFPAHDMARAAAYAAADAGYATDAAYGGDAAIYAAYTARAAADAATYAAGAAYAARGADADAATYAADAAAYGAYVARAAADTTAHVAVWTNISMDCDFLTDERDALAVTRRLTFEKLWSAGEPEGWRKAWVSAVGRLTELNQGLSVWVDWYDRRVKGHDAAFDIPGDTDRTEDKAILARLADATDEDFWGKGAVYVNATLQGWIDEARARVGPTDMVPPPVVPASVPPQNQNAIPFSATDAGTIRIDPNRNTDTLRTDADAKERYAEAIREAKALLARCRLSNSAARFVSGFENYLSAGGDTLADLRPSLFVQRGEKLRQEIAAYESGQQDSFLEPIADDLLIDLKGWRSAHNMAVGLDPVLMRLDTAMLGPDVKPALIPPAELHEFVADADSAEILDEGVREIVDEAIDLAPAIPDPNDRRTVWSVESVQNLVIEAFSVALNHPVKAVAGVVVTAAVGMKIAAGVVGGGLVTAKFLIKHRNWIETKLNNTPTWKSLLNQVCDRLEEWTPFKADKDDDGV